MYMKAVFSEKPDVKEAAADIRSQFGGMKPKMVLFFASTSFEPQGIAAAMQNEFAGAKVFGCTTAGELVGDRMLKNTVAAMCFDESAIADVDVGVVENIKGEVDVETTLGRFEEHFGVSMNDMSHTDYVGIVLMDGLTMAEERVMDSIGNKTSIAFLGGSAADNLTFTATHVFADGKAYSNAALLAVMKPKVKFTFLKTQSFCKRQEVLEPTKVDERTRTVFEINGVPAVDAYVKAIGKEVNDAPNYFPVHPTGVIMPDGEIFVRTPQKFNEDGSITFFCNVKKGIPLSLLEATDIVADTRVALEEKKKEFKSVAGIINFHCLFRTLILQSKNQVEEYCRSFAGVETLGFNTYGEAYLGHMNETSTMLLFGV
jgi:hypothetical protein